MRLLSGMSTPFSIPTRQLLHYACRLRTGAVQVQRRFESIRFASTYTRRNFGSGRSETTRDETR